MPEYDVLTEIHGRLIGLDDEQRLVIWSGQIVDPDAIPIIFPDGIIQGSNDPIDEDTGTVSPGDHSTVKSNGAIINLPESPLDQSTITVIISTDKYTEIRTTNTDQIDVGTLTRCIKTRKKGSVYVFKWFGDYWRVT